MFGKRRYDADTAAQPWAVPPPSGPQKPPDAQQNWLPDMNTQEIERSASARGKALAVAVAVAPTGVALLVLLALAPWPAWKWFAAPPILGLTVWALVYARDIWTQTPRAYDRRNPWAARPEAPAPPRKRLRVEAKIGKDTKILDLPFDEQKLRALADGLRMGQPFSEGMWTGKNRPFTRGEFADLRGEFLKRGWVRWKNNDAPAQGVELTPEGQAVILELSLPQQKAER
jgi:hypothetical protein